MYGETYHYPADDAHDLRGSVHARNNHSSMHIKSEPEAKGLEGG